MSELEDFTNMLRRAKVEYEHDDDTAQSGKHYITVFSGAEQYEGGALEDVE